jgi:hypothetical protein
VRGADRGPSSALRPSDCGSAVHTMDLPGGSQDSTSPWADGLTPGGGSGFLGVPHFRREPKWGDFSPGGLPAQVRQFPRHAHLASRRVDGRKRAQNRSQRPFPGLTQWTLTPAPGLYLFAPGKRPCAGSVTAEGGI